MTTVKIAKRYEQMLTKQKYNKEGSIDGVKIVEIKKFVVNDGTFNEVVRIEDGKITQPEELRGFEVKQINHSEIVPGTKKSWHLHREQDEIWFVHPNCMAIVGLLDAREGSTKDKAMRLALGGGKATLVYIPRGVAHGVSNPYHEPATMTYFVNSYFNSEDELRLPFGTGVSADFWEIQKG